MTNEQLGKYKDLGWEFKEDSWTSPHNGDIEDELLFKSPRMNDFVCILSSRHLIPKWKDVKLEEMLDMEKTHYAITQYEKIEGKVQNLLENALKNGQHEVVINLKKL